ncbi:STAS domain-containing protein [Roseiconus lacunae]|uniref:STAS domain-containing protein n=1 Tax=Roseiconus lacunae TaxID=2605694 RepID=A0ABT7PL81_9BACT|nr:STAS domain-containing protein [Roseiconus lacunae]MDM4017265.1 STAS domain-containing protein [Roseiconus lacunae]
METINIPFVGSVGVAHAEQLHALIREALQSGGTLQLDFSEAHDIDASILQLLIAAQAAAEDSDSTTIEWQGVTQQLANSFERAGASSFLSIDEIVSAIEDAQSDATSSADDVTAVSEANIEPQGTPGESNVDSEATQSTEPVQEQTVPLSDVAGDEDIITVADVTSVEASPIPAQRDESGDSAVVEDDADSQPEQESGVADSLAQTSTLDQSGEVVADQSEATSTPEVPSASDEIDALKTASSAEAMSAESTSCESTATTAEAES